jgi:hypothetical protein
VEKRLEDSGDRVPEYFPRAKGNRHEVAKSGVNLDRLIWKGHVTYIHRLWRRSPSEEIIVGEVKTLEARII